MLPNTFEGAIATYKVEGSTLHGGYVTRWAGYDSGDDISTFKKFDADIEAQNSGESNGAVILGITNESIENLAVQGWYYGVDKVADLYYADAAYAMSFGDSAELETVVQYGGFKEKNESGFDGSVFGIGTSLKSGIVTIGLAYNQGFSDEGKVPPIGFGGGPYLTSMEEWTIEEMEDVRAYQVKGELDLGLMGAEGLVLTTLYGVFDSDPTDVKVSEFDVIATYEITESLSADVSYAKINDKNNNANGGDDAGCGRFLARISYSF